jgi:hypothetical protein
MQCWVSILTLTLRPTRTVGLSALRADSSLPPRTFLGTHFFHRLSGLHSYWVRTQGCHLKISTDHIGNRTRDLPSCDQTSCVIASRSLICAIKTVRAWRNMTWHDSKTTNSAEQRHFYCSVQLPPAPQTQPLTARQTPTQTTKQAIHSTHTHTHSILLKSTLITKIIQLCFTVQFVIDMCSLQEDMSAWYSRYWPFLFVCLRSYRRSKLPTKWDKVANYWNSSSQVIAGSCKLSNVAQAPWRISQGINNVRVIRYTTAVTQAHRCPWSNAGVHKFWAPGRRGV